MFVQVRMFSVTAWRGLCTVDYCVLLLSLIRSFTLIFSPWRPASNTATAIRSVSPSVKALALGQHNFNKLYLEFSCLLLVFRCFKCLLSNSTGVNKRDEHVNRGSCMCCKKSLCECFCGVNLENGYTVCWKHDYEFYTFFFLFFSNKNLEQKFIWMCNNNTP